LRTVAADLADQLGGQACDVSQVSAPGVKVVDEIAQMARTNCAARDLRAFSGDRPPGSHVKWYAQGLFHTRCAAKAVYRRQWLRSNEIGARGNHR
jgi:hypothetical protein